MIEMRSCSIGSVILALGVAGILWKTASFLFKLLFARKLPALREKNWKRDVVYLYQLHGTSTLPSVCPYCIKVEGFLRIHEMKFERRYVVFARGSNGKVPFIELNGEHIADSQIILRRLARQFDIKEYSNDGDAVIGHAISRQVDSHTALIFAYFKLCTGAGELVSATLKGAFPSWIISGLTMLPLRYILMERKGLNIFTKEQYAELLEHELVSLQTLLGEKQYLFGGDITSADLALFAHLAAVLYFSAESEPKGLLISPRFEQLKLYTERVRDAVFLNECHE